VTPIKFENCTVDLFGLKNSSDFYTTGLQKYKCISPS